MSENHNEVSLICLMICLIVVSVRTFGVMYDHTFFFACKSPDQNKAKNKWAVNHGIAYGHFNLPRLFVWVNIHILTLSALRITMKNIYTNLLPHCNNTIQYARGGSIHCHALTVVLL